MGTTDYEKLESVICELTILLPRITDQYRSGMEGSIALLKIIQTKIPEELRHA